MMRHQLHLFNCWQPAEGPLRPLAMGVTCGLIVSTSAFVLELLLRPTNELSYFILVLGGLAGPAIGLAVWRLRPRRVVTLPWLVVSRGLVGGGIAVLLCFLLMSVGNWVTGANYSPMGHPHPSPPMAMDLAAIGKSLGLGLFFTLLFGLPVFAGGSIVGAFVAPITRAH